MGTRNFTIYNINIIKFKKFVVPIMGKYSQYLKFNTAIITYPSDFKGLLTTQKILDYYQTKGLLTPTTKLVIAQEDPDEEIQRTHYHLYWDDVKRKQCTTSHFDIPLEYPIVCFIHPDKTREYKDLLDMESQLGWDNGEEMVAKLDEYCKENGFINHEVLKTAHPNIQLRKKYIGSKYEMLRYVVKQKLICRTRFDIDEELEWLLDGKEELEERLSELIEEKLILQCNVQTIDELIELLLKLKEERDRKNRRRSPTPGKKGRKPKQKLDQQTKLFLDFLREKMLEEDGRITKNELLKMIKKDENYWYIFSQNYLNYSKLINDMFKGKPPAKPKKNYENIYWVPIKLYNYLVWLDDWIRRWYEGEKMESRPKGLIIIGPSRIGKTSLISTMGDFSYIKNVWNMDNWESLTPFTVMDDMDAGDEGKGLSFCWYKPFFGAQDAVTITDKFKPKQDIVNGKPLIWLNNYDYKETFQSKTAQSYIECNMEIVYLNRPLFEKPEPFEWIEGHSDYIKWDPKNTWYYKNKINPIQPPLNTTITNNNINNNNNFYTFIDETEKVIEQAEEIEPLNERKRRLEIEIETGVATTSTTETTAGRPIKRNRNQN